MRVKRNHAFTVLSSICALALPSARTPAQTDWRLPEHIGAREQAAAAFDPVRDRFVVVGGTRDFSLLDGAFEWDGAQWHRRTAVVEPPFAQMRRPQMIFDPVAGHCLLHGWVGTPVHAEVWTWDGVTWTRLPDAPVLGELAFDAGVGRPVLVVRTSLTTPHELYEWDGVQWTVRATTGVKPTWFETGPAAFDVVRGCLVMPVQGALFELHGAVWQRFTPANMPLIGLTNESRQTATYDPRSGGVVLCGGEFYPDTLSEVSVWDGAQWTTLPAGRPRQKHAAAFDSVRGRLLVFGGADFRNPQNPEWRYLGDLVSFDGAWRTEYDATAPAHLVSTASAYDRARDVVVTFGGTWAGQATDELHLFDGQRWSFEQPAVAPTARSAAVMAWDDAAQRLVLFGGRDAAGALLADTWVRDAAGWRLLSTTGGPSPRAGAQMTFDSVRDRVVLVGGSTSSGSSNETWELAGSTWTLRAAGFPPASSFGGLVFDKARGRSVLHGGFASDATYEWDGSAWFSTNPANRPPAGLAGRCALTFDEARARTVLVVQELRAPATWEWDGTNWTETTAPTPSGTQITFGGGGFVYHAGIERCVLEPSGQFATSSTIHLGSVAPAAWAEFGAGCSGAGAMPTLQGVGLSRPWLGDTFTLRLAHPSAALGAVVVGLSDVAWSGGPLPFALGSTMPGCALLASSDAFGIVGLQSGGVDYALAIPNVPAFVGLAVFLQGFAGDPIANTAGIVASSGVRATIGVR